LTDFQHFFDSVRTVIEDAHESEFRSDRRTESLEGLSGESIVACLQGLVRNIPGKPNSCYVEIGVFRGLTLLSTSLSNPDVQCIGIDNFSLFDPNHENFDFVNQQIKDLNIPNARILNMDFEEALLNLDAHLNGAQIGVLFIDGPHDYRSQLVALLEAKQYFTDDVVIVIDDSNYSHVRQSTADFLVANDDFALIFEAYTESHPANMEPVAKAACMKGWWNGVNVVVRDSEKLLPRNLPSTDSKVPYYESHDVFRHEFAEIAIDALRYATNLLDGDATTEESAREKLKNTLQNHRKKFPDRFVFQNTNSGGLPEFKMHA